MGVREKPPAIQITAVSADGQRTRWGPDETDPSRVPSGLRWSTSIPGGADTLTTTLPRDPERSYPDLGLLTELQVSRNGGRTQTYRLEETPKVSGDQMAVEPAAKGYRAALEDRSDARALFVDRDLSNWGGMSRGRRIAHLGSGLQANDASTSVDPNSGLPSLVLESQGRWTATGMYTEGLYDAGEGLKVGRIYANWTDTGYGSGYVARFGVTSTPETDGSAWDPSTDLLTGSASGTVNTTVTAQRYARVDVAILSAVADDVPRAFSLANLAVYGDHGLTPQGASPGGFYTGQMVEWIVQNRSALTVGTVDDGTFLHPHAAFKDPTTALSIIENLTRYEPLYDWMVWDQEFSFRRRGTYGRRWRARVGPSGLRASGQSLERLYNEVAVKVADPLYGDLIVGPTGSGYGNTSANLTDSDPDNPVNKAGVTRRALLDMGTGTAAGAIEVGRRFLEETKRLDNSGQCELTGFVEDDAGTLWPVDEVRAGDEIQFTDAADSSWRHIAATDYSADSQTNALSLDAPPQTIDALLARLSAKLIPLG